MLKRLLSLIMALAALAANAAETTTEKLPVRRVVLYKNGVGYFEHTGRVHGSQELKIDFTSSQLNDVLKSLTVLDLNGGRISGVGYNSVAPIGEQLKALRLPLDESTTLEGFLNALRGTRIDVRNGAVPVSGRLLSVEEKITHKGRRKPARHWSFPWLPRMARCAPFRLLRRPVCAWPIMIWAKRSRNTSPW